MQITHSLIIGGTKGLGKVLAKQLIDEGHHVSILARKKPQDTKDILQNALYVEADLLKEDTVFSALEYVLQKRKIINNLVFLQRYKEQDDRWNGDLEVGLNATRKIIEYLKNHFVKTTPYSSIIMVSSIASKFANDSQPLSYSVTKAGLDLMMIYYAAQLGPKGIRVNSVSPITFIKPESQTYYENNQKINSLYQKMVPLGRMCNATDVANVVRFLCSEQSAFVSGQNIIIDGGLSTISHENLPKILAEKIN